MWIGNQFCELYAMMPRVGLYGDFGEISAFALDKGVVYSRGYQKETAELSNYFRGNDMIDLSDSTLDERLQRRTADGRYELGECELVVNIRALRAADNMAGVRRLCEVLLKRCAPVFQRHTQGLQHRPELREEAIANMAEHLLREVQDPGEVFMTKNFIHYLRCLCADEFNRVLRQEGLYYRRDDEGRPSGRPQHVPRSLVEHLQAPRDDDEGQIGADLADPDDHYEEMHASDESHRLVMLLEAPRD